MEENEREYTNGEITVFWKPSECIHATTCFRELRSVFNPGKRPWVNMQGAPTSEIIKIVDLCPTNALTYKQNNQMKVQTKKEENFDKKDISETKVEEKPVMQPPVEVRVMLDGPLIVKGEFIVIGANGQQLKKMKIASFCRCGHSDNMPYCDGAHRKIGWRSK